MFTVVIAEQEHISGIEEYEMFLKPFLNKTNVVFCPWNTQGQTLDEAVPDLERAVARHQDWRAVIVTPEQGLYQRNPFQYVCYEAPEREDQEPEEAYFDRLWQVKKAAFEEAARQPLTRLVTYLCEGPMVSGGMNNQAGVDPEFAQYRREALYKQQLRTQIRGERKLSIALPAEVLCFAKRTCPEEEKSIAISWTAHVDHQYSRFCDWNLYFDKMRFLVFDILPKKHQGYAFDYIRFLYALLLLANHEAPKSSLRPQRVYELDCENDEHALCALLSRYEGKLVATDEHVAHKLHELENKPKVRLTDREAETIFCARVTVPVTVVQEFDETDLYVPHDSLGLSTDCPESELGVWVSGYNNSQRALHRYLKQPRRALKRAVGDLQNMNVLESDRIEALSPFQVEDIQEHIHMEEMNLVNTSTTDLTDVEAYKKKMEKASQEVYKKIDTRMTRKTTLVLAAVILGLYLVGFLPLIFTNLLDLGSLVFSLVMMGIATVVMAITGIVALLFMRGALHRKFSDFNGVMGQLVNDISGSTGKHSKYLSHMCNIMRGYSVLNRFEAYESPLNVQMSILQKHRMDILRCREELREVFGQYMTEEASQEEPYLYDFTRPVDFSYPLPYSEDQSAVIEFMQPGNQVTVPVSFVRRITLRMEELYD